MENKLNFALLIDADNASNKNINSIFMACLQFGNLFIRRVYGDFTSQNLAAWKEICSEYNIQPIQQFRNTIGKNATDSALIIDAMDILYQKKEELNGGFILVSSDSDFTKLASRIRENNLKVIGIGKQNTAESFINACSEFYFVENLEDNILAKRILQNDNDINQVIINNVLQKIKNELKNELSSEIKNLLLNEMENYYNNYNTIKQIRYYITEYYNNSKHTGEYANLGGLANYIKERIENFSHKNYDCPNFSTFMINYFNDVVIVTGNYFKIKK